jgi:hypothetical protein
VPAILGNAIFVSERIFASMLEEPPVEATKRA